jgi:hypothetical protein
MIPGFVPWIKHMKLVFRVTNSSAVTYMPTSFWFAGMRLFQQGSDNIIRYFPVAHAVQTLGMLKDDEKTTFRNLAMSDQLAYTQMEQVPANSTLDFEYPLFGPWDIDPIPFSTWKDPLIIAMIAHPGGPCSAGTSTNVTCTATLVVESMAPSRGDTYEGKELKYTRYLESMMFLLTAKTLTSGAKTLCDLTSVQGLQLVMHCKCSLTLQPPS